MEDTLNPVGKVYEGFWIDWSSGKILGSRLTLCPTLATILTNSLAMFVALCGIQLWTIVRYLLHKKGAKLQPDISTPHLNQQVILRNANSALATARRMAELAWVSRKTRGQHSKRVYAIAFTAMIYAELFTVAGVFSNKAISAALDDGSSLVLLRNPNCGIWNQTYQDIANTPNIHNENEFNLFVQYQSKRMREVQRSLEYAQSCYGSDLVTLNMSSTCKMLKSTRVGFSPSFQGLCPFDSQICHATAGTVVRNTGFINSHHDLGINAKPEDRLVYQRVTNCTVLNGTAYVDGWNGTGIARLNPNASREEAHANYGPTINRKVPWTYAYSNFASYYTNFTYKSTQPYQLDVEEAFASADPQWSFSEFEPIAELAQGRADLNLIFLSYTGMYLGPVRDPWFSALQEQQLEGSSLQALKPFSSDEAVSTIGCTEQHNFCTNDHVCTGLFGFDQVQNVEHFNSILTPNQNATFDRIIRALADSRLSSILRALPKTNAPLLASIETFGGGSGIVFSPRLPDDQWESELEYWHTITMAHLQRTVAQWATGQIAPKSQHDQYLLQPSEPQDKFFCDSLVIPHTFFQSFNVVAITLIFVFGALIIVFSLLIEHLAPEKPWADDDMLELRRRTPKGRHSFPQRVWADEFSPSRQRAIPQKSSYGIPSTPTMFHQDPQISNEYGELSRVRTYKPHLEHINQPFRNSWMAISLNSLDSSSSERPVNTAAKNGIPRPELTPSSSSTTNTTSLSSIWTERRLVAMRGSGWI